MAVGYPAFTSVVRRRHRELSRVVAGIERGHDGVVGLESPRERVEREQCGEFALTWRGPISPFPAGMSFEEIQAIIADLDEDRPVRVMTDGVLAHYEGCGGTHVPRPGLRLGHTLYGAFLVEIAYRR